METVDFSEFERLFQVKQATKKQPKQASESKSIERKKSGAV